MDISAASEEFKILKESPCYSHVLIPLYNIWICKPWDTSQLRAEESEPQSALG